MAVRKRIIRILRDVVDRHPNFEKNPEIIAKIIRRISDEDGVRKLVLETLVWVFKFIGLFVCTDKHPISS